MFTDLTLVSVSLRDVSMEIRKLVWIMLCSCNRQVVVWGDWFVRTG